MRTALQESAGWRPLTQPVHRRNLLPVATLVTAALLTSGASPTFAAEIPFAPADTVSSTADGVRDVAAADVDRDGDIDLVSASFDDDTIAWYENDGNQNFTERVVTTSADGARAVAVGDLDGDGDPDLASASFNDDKISWYENLGTSPPTFTPHVITEDPDAPGEGQGSEGVADGAWGLAAADLDRDGDLDLAFTAFRVDMVAWYENRLAEATADWQLRTVPIVADGATSVAVADIDGNGSPDLASTSFADDTIRWHASDGGAPPSFSSVTVSSTADGARSVAVGDIDGDGDIDLVSASQDDDTVRVWASSGAATPVFTEHVVTTTSDGVQFVAINDFDRDGDQDLLTAASIDDTVRWHEQTATLSFTELTIDGNANGAVAVVAEDLDGDGDLDAVSAAANADSVAWHQNLTIHRSAVFPSRSVITTLADGAQSVFAVDVDGDGDVDALSASYSDDKIAWYENLGPDTGSGPCSVTYPGTSACFGGQQVITTLADGAQSVFAVDVDGDGDVDALSASYRDDKIAWYENLGPDIGSGPCSATYPGTSACFGAQQVITTLADFAPSVFAVDVDGDGDVDALSASDEDDKIAWYENLGPDTGSGPCSATYPGTSACFGAQQVITTLADFAQSVFAADVDGDGDVDALSASYVDAKIAWYENLGPDTGSGPCSVTYPGTSACFGGQQVITTLADGAQSVFAADVDGDGDLDALSASPADDTIAWYENLGPDDGSGPCSATYPAGTSACFGAQQVITTLADGAQSVFAADVDGDGDLDAFSASANDDTIAWYENLGPDDGSGPCSATFPAGTSACFGPQRVITTLADLAPSVFAADVDGDGDLDALSASGADDTIAWYENRGGQFALATTDRAQRVMLGGQVEDVFAVEVTHRGRAGDTDLELATLELLFELNPGSPLSSAQANDLIQEARVYLDDGSGAFEAAIDTLVAGVAPLTLVDGVQTVSLADGDPLAQVTYGTQRSYLVVLQIQADAASESPASFLVTHLTESSSSAEDRDHDIPLALETTPNVGTGLIDTFLNSATCWAPYDLNLSGATVSTTLTCEAGEDLRAGGGFTVVTGGDLTLRAGRKVELLDGFDVQGGALTAENDPSLLP